MNTQTFYQLDSKGKVRVWSIRVDKVSDDLSNIVIFGGLETGKKIETVTPISEGKNIGKVNETTVYEQACKDAQTEIDKKVKQGYVADRSQMKQKGDTATIKAPMKGFAYHPTGKNKSLTLDDLGIRNELVILDSKLDGWRYRIHITKDSCTFYTSSGDVTLGFPQIEKRLREVFDKNINYWENKYGVTEYYLDGEIYRHMYDKDGNPDPMGGYNNVASACASIVNITPEKQALRDAMQFYLFDVCIDAPYTTREKVINYFYDDVNVVRPLRFKVNATEKVIEEKFSEFLSAGYEGLMIRTLHTPYEFKRSKQLTKYKPLIDDEFEIIGFKKSIAGETLGSIQFKMNDGSTFWANPKASLGSDKVKKQIWDNQKDYLGKWATVEFLEYTPDGLPRHPRVKALRKGKSQD